MPYVKKVKLSNIAPFEKAEIEFQKGLNIISGVNGVGKTTLLNCIRRLTLSSGQVRLMSSRIEPLGGLGVGKLEIIFDTDFNTYSRHVECYQNELVGEIREIPSGQRLSSSDLVFFNTDRAFRYTRIGIKSNVDEIYGKDQRPYGLSARAGLIKGWLIEFDSLLKENHAHDESSLKNWELVKQTFSMVDPSISFYGIRDNEVKVLTRTGIVDFERLPSGYQSCIIILLGLIRQFERRRKSVSAKDYDGIILIDEIDLHLHPKWQGVFINALTWVAPEAQIIATTHSPHIIQQLDRGQLIALYIGESGFPKKSKIDPGPYGFKGWTIEEILRYVMELEDTRSHLLQTTLEQFKTSVRIGDSKAAKVSYEKLMMMLHRDNPLRPLYSMQLESIGGYADD